MKTVEEINAIAQSTLEKIKLTGAHAGDTRIVVGMATCGLSAGARPVYDALIEKTKAIKGVSVTQTGCIGMCRLEPIVEVLRAGQPKITYVKVNADMVGRIVDEHIAGGKPVKEFTIGEAD